MKALFKEMTIFESLRQDYLVDDEYLELQKVLLNDPECGDEIPDSGGLRKLRFRDIKRNKGKRSGLRIIYFWHQPARQFWLFTLYGKDEVSDLSPKERRALGKLLKQELKERINYGKA